MKIRVSLCGYLVALLVGIGSADGAERPNVVFILVDDLGWTDLGCYGSSFYDTPHLDAFAQGATRFTNAYAASPVCSPTRAAIMTGKNPVRVQITDWIPGMAPPDSRRAKSFQLLTPAIVNQLPHEEVTIAEALQDLEYHTFFAGKWHLGHQEHWPQTQGFDINRGGHHRGSPPGGYYAPYNNPALDDGPEGEYLTDRLARECVRFLEQRDATKPFFAFLSFYTVHTPIQGCQKYDEVYRRRAEELPNTDAPLFRPEHRGRTRLIQNNPKYAAMVRSMDENVGRVLDALETEDAADNTLVIFTSDNGGLTTLKRLGPTSVLPLRAGKGWCYEGGIRVPLLIRAPGITQSGATCDTPAISMDYFPTILEYVGAVQPPELHQDGRSLIPALRAPQQTEPRTLIWHFPHYHGSTWTPGSAIREGDWKLLEFYEHDKVELYNLAEDLGERNDLAETHPETAAALRRELRERLQAMGAEFPIPHPDQGTF